MNEFKYQVTIFPDFCFNMFSSRETTGEISVSTSIGIPKDLKKNKVVRCDISVEVVNEASKETDIKFKAVSVFDIATPKPSEKTLLKDAANYCIPIAMKKTDEKFAQVSQLLSGQIINLQLSERYAEE